MIRIEFSDSDKAALSYERFNHPHPFVQRKMEALWLKSQGLPHKDICRLTDICSTTLTEYLREYREAGIEALKILAFRRPRSDLEAHRASLEAYFPSPRQRQGSDGEDRRVDRNQAESRSRARVFEENEHEMPQGWHDTGQGRRRSPRRF